VVGETGLDYNSDQAVHYFHYIENLLFPGFSSEKIRQQ
jgi:hypothetical protein